MDQPFRDLDYSRHRLSTSSEERTIFYIDDMSPPALLDSSPISDYGPSGPHQHSHRHSQHRQHHRLCEPPDLSLAPDLQASPRALRAQQPQQRRRKSSVSSQCGSGTISGPGSGSGRPRRQRRPSEFVEHAVNRRSSHCSQQPGLASRPRANSCARPTPLGDGRRASVCKKSRPRRPSSAHRRDSVRPTGRQDGGSRSPSGLLTPTSLEGAIKDPREAEQARRHRRIAMVLLGTFIFILSASVLAVIVTLTHSSFHRPPVGSRELAEHRANVIINDVIVENKTEFRKENEELLNSLNRDSSIPENTTSSLPP